MANSSHYWFDDYDDDDDDDDDDDTIKYTYSHNQHKKNG